MVHSGIPHVEHNLVVQILSILFILSVTPQRRRRFTTQPRVAQRTPSIGRAYYLLQTLEGFRSR